MEREETETTDNVQGVALDEEHGDVEVAHIERVDMERGEAETTDNVQGVEVADKEVLDNELYDLISSNFT